MNILVFPCGSEIGLEIYRALKYIRNFNLIGGTSVKDHGEFVYENVVENIPFYTDPSFIEEINKVVELYEIDIIYPTMDSVITFLAKNKNKIRCEIVAPDMEVTELCLNKKNTYLKLQSEVQCPKIFENMNDLEYPVFAKPNIGYGSRGANIISNQYELEIQLNKYPDSIVCEYLPGEEYTVDCFSDVSNQLLFSGARIRDRIMNGISVSTLPVDNTEFIDLIYKINKVVGFKGAWFAQFKRNINNQLVLMEVAARFGGSSSIHRNKGINFPLLSIYNLMRTQIDIIVNDYDICLDRALDNKYKIDIDYEHVYVDFDDCLYINNRINIQLLSFLYQCLNNDKKVYLISKHDGNLIEKLKTLRVFNIFDEVIHLHKGDKKYRYIRFEKSIFIDDSYVERKEMKFNANINVFSPDMVECLIY